MTCATARLQRPHDQAAVLELIDLLNGWLADNPELMRIFAIWLRALLLRQSKYPLALPKVQDLKELKMTLAARFEEWAHQHKDEGRNEGRREGEARSLQRLLVARFGPLSSATLSQLEQASLEQIETWFDRAITARSLGDVLDGGA